MNKTFQEIFQVRATDCDRFRRMRPDMLFIAMQEGGERHAHQLGIGYDAMMQRGLFFVLARIHVQFDRAPRVGETVVHTTWPGVGNRFFCPRFHTFTLEDGTPLARAGALWVILDAKNRKIASALTAGISLPDNSDIPAPIELPMRQPPLGETTEYLTRTPVYSEFDVNSHVNNTKYIAWLCDALGNAAMDGRYLGDLTVNYEKEICEEIPLTLALSRDGDRFSLLVTSETGVKHFAAAGTLKKEENP